jgi:formylglycine-generating enzyme required for sulfatase activity
MRDRAVTLDDYWIDRFEVTNRQFKMFVDAGGIMPSYWTEPFASARTLSGRSHGAVSRYHRPAGTRDVGAQHVSGRPRGRRSAA